ncbi:MAG TPA: cysteine desulfurase family protein [Ignavibacteria bacterium]|nr:cysteine desulfurase family protein [Ignavibacteria bacterium]
MNSIYFDNAATTPVADEVLDAMIPYLKTNFGNSSSIHSFGKSAKVLIEDTRDLISQIIGSKPREIYFTSGGTESNNQSLKGLAFASLDTKKNEFITTKIEHLAVLDTLNYLKEKFGFKIHFIETDNYGFINFDSLNEKINENTLCVSVMHSNNETGVINDINKISEYKNKNNFTIHSDTIQSFGKGILKLTELNCDIATISSHKIYGPKGIAAVYIKDKIKTDKFIHGGSQERNSRGGTENIPGIAGFKKALEILISKYESDILHYTKIKNYIIENLKKDFRDKLILNTPEKNSLPNIINLSVNLEKSNVDPEMLLILLDLDGIAVSGGSACTSGSHKPSHVLLSLGIDEKTALATIRISIGRYNTLEEADKLIKVLKKII